MSRLQSDGRTVAGGLREPDRAERRKTLALLARSTEDWPCSDCRAWLLSPPLVFRRLPALRGLRWFTVGAGTVSLDVVSSRLAAKAAELFDLMAVSLP